MPKRAPIREAEASARQISNARIVVAKVLLRADAVYDAMVAPGLYVDFTSETVPAAGLFELANTPGGCLLHGAALYAALVWQVAATWGGMNTGIKLSVADVDAALDTLPMPRLQEFRNSVMHTGRIGDPREEELMPDMDTVLETCRAAMEVVRNYLRGNLSRTAQRLRDRIGGVT